MRLARLLRESAIESALVKGVRRISGWAYKWVSPQHRGVPDRIVCFGIERAIRVYQQRRDVICSDPEQDVRDIIAAAVELVELKREGAKATLQQMREHERLRRLGLKVTVLSGLSAVNQWLREHGD